MNLIESLVALAIAMALAVAALSGSADSARDVRRDRAQDLAADLAEDLVERFVAAGPVLDTLLAPGAGERTGELDLDLALGLALVPADEAAAARRTLEQAGVRAIRLAWRPALAPPRERLASVSATPLGAAGPVPGAGAVRLYTPSI